jgi:hypothetical protein
VYIFKIVSVLSFLKIVLLIVPINYKYFSNLNSHHWFVKPEKSAGMKFVLSYEEHKNTSEGISSLS